jgi:hypothetical protein
LLEVPAVAGPFAAAGAAEAGAAVAGAAGAAARARVGGGGGGGLDARVELVMVDAIFCCGAGVAFAGDAVGAAAVTTAVFEAGASDVGLLTFAAVEVPPLPAELPLRGLFPDPVSAKNSRQMRSTLCGSARNC